MQMFRTKSFFEACRKESSVYQLHLIRKTLTRIIDNKQCFSIILLSNISSLFIVGDQPNNSSRKLPFQNPTYFVARIFPTQITEHILPQASPGQYLSRRMLGQQRCTEAW